MALEGGEEGDETFVGPADDGGWIYAEEVSYLAGGQRRSWSLLRGGFCCHDEKVSTTLTLWQGLQ